MDIWIEELYLSGRMPSNAFDILSMFHEHRDRLEITIWMHCTQNKCINITGKENKRVKTYPPISTPSHPDYSSPTTSQMTNMTRSYTPSRAPPTYSYIPTPMILTTTLVFCITTSTGVLLCMRMKTALPMLMRMHMWFLPRTFPLRCWSQTKQSRASVRTVPMPPLSPFSHVHWGCSRVGRPCTWCSEMKVKRTL